MSPPCTDSAPAGALPRASGLGPGRIPYLSQVTPLRINCVLQPMDRLWKVTHLQDFVVCPKMGLTMWVHQCVPGTIQHRCLPGSQMPWQYVDCVWFLPMDKAHLLASLLVHN